MSLSPRRKYRGVEARRPLGDGISVAGSGQLASLGADGARPVQRASEPALTSVKEFLRLQSAAPRMSLFGRIFGLDPLARPAARAYAGALAEVEVSDALAALGDEWSIVDGASLGTDEPVIEHVVVGPAGVFSIALCNHAGERVWVGERTFVVDGTRFPHVRDAEYVADSVADRMSRALGAPVTVTPCLVVTSPAELTLTAGSRRVEIVSQRQFGSWLASLPRLMSQQAVERHRRCAESQGTWFVATREATGSAAVRAEFDRVHSRIVRARRVCLSWAIAGAVVSQLALLASAFGAGAVLKALGL